MTGWTVHQGLAVALDLESVDTDQIIPARFMSTPRAQGYGSFLLHDLRFDGDGASRADFVLNRHPKVSVLVTRRNFGSGSSREAAVYALVDFGIRAVIAPSFGDIFASNAVNNGLLPARAETAVIDRLIKALGNGAANASVDLAGTTATVSDHTFRFELDATWREKLMNGWDDIDLTLNHRGDIAAYRDRIHNEENWRFPASAG